MNYVPDFLTERVRRSLPDQDDLPVDQVVVAFLPVMFSIPTIFSWALVFFLAAFASITLVLLVTATGSRSGGRFTSRAKARW